MMAAGLLLNGCGSMADPTSWFDDNKVETVEPNELVDFEPTLKVETLWETDVGSGADGQRIKLVPRVDGGRVYAANADGTVIALDSLNGNRLWSVETELPVSGGPGSGEGLVLLGTSDGELVALNQDNGEIVWKTQLSSEILSVPAADVGVVVAHTIDGKLYGLDATTGKQLWLYSRKVPVLTLRGAGSPVISGSTVFAGFAGGKLVALDLAKGFVQWDVSVTAPSGRSELERMVDIDGDPFIENGVVYVVTYQGEVAAVSEYTGTMLWRKKLSSYSGLAADWRHIYISDDTGNVWGINPENGAAMWKQSKLLNRRLSAPAVLDGYLVVGDYNGYLHWLSHDDGRMVARSRVGSDIIRAAPVVSDGVIYVYGSDGELAALKPVQ